VTGCCQSWFEKVARSWIGVSASGSKLEKNISLNIDLKLPFMGGNQAEF
jgi:hypothetical protein